MLMMIGLTDLMPKPMRILRSSCARDERRHCEREARRANALHHLAAIDHSFLSLVLSAIDPMDQ